jgi:hypothetical protein
MNRLESGVLNDYSVQQMERMAFDHSPDASRLTVDEALKAVREQAAKPSPLAKIIPGFDRLK